MRGQSGPAQTVFPDFYSGIPTGRCNEKFLCYQSIKNYKSVNYPIKLDIIFLKIKTNSKRNSLRYRQSDVIYFYVFFY
jgi:hypothetical protein